MVAGFSGRRATKGVSKAPCPLLYHGTPPPFIILSLSVTFVNLVYTDLGWAYGYEDKRLKPRQSTLRL